MVATQAHWSFQFSFEFRWTPRYLTEVLQFEEHHKLVIKSGGRVFVCNAKNFAFWWIQINSFATAAGYTKVKWNLSQFTEYIAIDLIILSLFDWIVKFEITSSAKIFVGTLTTLEISLIYRINRKGSRIYSCGTPDHTWHQSENCPLITTLWWWVGREVWNHCSKAPVIPIASSLSNSLSWDTVDWANRESFHKVKKYTM